jgi:hypothetical protein
MQNYKISKISDDENFKEWIEVSELLRKITNFLSGIDIDIFKNPKQIQELIDTNKRVISFKKTNYGQFQNLNLNENMSYRFNPFVRLQNCKRLTAKYYKILPKIIEQAPNSSFHFLTLNIPHCDISDLKQKLKHLGASFTKFLKSPKIARLLKDGGYYAVFETSRHDGLAVPHIHVVLHLPSRFKNGANYIKPETFENLWIDAVKIASASTHIVEIEPNKTQSLIGHVIARICYMNKPEKLKFLTEDKEFTFEFFNQTFGTILEKSSGTLLYKKTKSDVKNVEQQVQLVSADFKNDEVIFHR